MKLRRSAALAYDDWLARLERERIAAYQDVDCPTEWRVQYLEDLYAQERARMLSVKSFHAGFRAGHVSGVELQREFTASLSTPKKAADHPEKT